MQQGLGHRAGPHEAGRLRGTEASGRGLTGLANRLDDISRYYDAAEKLYGAHGKLGNDPTAPPGQPEPPYPFVGHAPTVARIVESMAAQGTHPVELPVGVDYGNGGKCVLCSTCDGFPCRLRAKNDAEMRAVRPALESPDVKLSVRTAIDHLITSPDGRRVVAAVGEQDGVPVKSARIASSYMPAPRTALPCY